MVSTPLKNISQLGLLFPIYGKIKNVPKHQPALKYTDGTGVSYYLRGVAVSPALYIFKCRYRIYNTPENGKYSMFTLISTCHLLTMYISMVALDSTSCKHCSMNILSKIIASRPWFSSCTSLGSYWCSISSAKNILPSPPKKRKGEDYFPLNIDYSQGQTLASRSVNQYAQ